MINLFKKINSFFRNIFIDIPIIDENYFSKFIYKIIKKKTIRLYRLDSHHFISQLTYIGTLCILNNAQNNRYYLSIYSNNLLNNSSIIIHDKYTIYHIFSITEYFQRYNIDKNVIPIFLLDIYQKEDMILYRQK